MQISLHYPAFAHPTIIAVTNNERARLLRVHDREVEEFAELHAGEVAKPEAHTPGVFNLEDAKQELLKELYRKLGAELSRILQNAPATRLIICVPEINKNLLTETLPHDLTAAIEEIIPKNLANMDLATMLRILLEG